MTESSVARFYDELADDYHLIYADWDTSIRRQGAALDALIGQDGATVLDCSCGIGTQAIGLALRSFYGLPFLFSLYFQQQHAPTTGLWTGDVPASRHHGGHRRRRDDQGRDTSTYALQTGCPR